MSLVRSSGSKPCGLQAVDSNMINISLYVRRQRGDKVSLWHCLTQMSDETETVWMKSPPSSQLTATCSSPPQLEYHAPDLYGMVLEVVVKSKKTFVAATNIKLEEELLDKEIWFLLGNCAIWAPRELHCRPAASRGRRHTERKPKQDTSQEQRNYLWINDLFIGCK